MMLFLVEATKASKNIVSVTLFLKVASERLSFHGKNILNQEILK